MSIATTAAPVGVPSADSQPQSPSQSVDAAPATEAQTSLAERVRADGIEFILALFVDLRGTAIPMWRAGRGPTHRG
jgi:hypothetical protein